MPSASTRRVRAAVSGSPSRLPTNAGADIRLFAIELNARVTGFAPSNGTELADPVTATRRGRPDAVGCVASLEWLEMAIAAISSLHSSLHSTLCNACYLDPGSKTRPAHGASIPQHTNDLPGLSRRCDDAHAIGQRSADLVSLI